MRLSVNLGYWRTAADVDLLDIAVEAELLGYSVVWTAEAHGSDAATVLGWLAARTDRIGIGSAALQIPARTPAMTAMTAVTLDNLSGGRFRLGLGVSGVQVAEGFHGVPFNRPLARTREYLDLVRLGLSQQPLRNDGEHYPLRWPDGPGSAMGLSVSSYQGRPIPIYLAAMGPKNVALAGEIADGWLSVFFCPSRAEEILAPVRAGRERAGQSMDGFDVVVTMPLVVGSDWRECADSVRPYAGTFIGGMGSRGTNFYYDLVARMGYARAAAKVWSRFQAQEYEAAFAALPETFLDEISLLGPAERIAERMQVLAKVGVTTVAVYLCDQSKERAITALREAAKALELSGVGS
jgi:F420-dependent oxidoreductase-like protein